MMRVGEEEEAPGNSGTINFKGNGTLANPTIPTRLGQTTLNALLAENREALRLFIEIRCLMKGILRWGNASVHVRNT
jgi:hypothetical protein